MTDVLLGSKVLTPPVVPHHVARAAAVSQLDAGRSKTLTVVTAPAGYGKSALLAEWAKTTTDRVSWLRLDAADDDPAMFVRYLVESVRVVVPEAARGAVDEVSRGASTAAVISALLEGARASNLPLVTVIDDMHRISEPAVIELCASTVNTLPRSWRWIISSRVEPPIGMARRRLDRSVIELTENDLRFDEDAANRLITDGLGVTASPQAVRALNGRVQGWAAGLCMAGLAAAGARDPDAALLAYSGRDRLLGQYFAEEVFARLPARLQQFLLDTSVLHTVDPDLCAAVIGADDAAQLIVEAARRHLFIAPINERQGDVFEYHDLFAEWLATELQRRMPGRDAELRLRAAEWCLSQRMVAQAIRYSLDARDWALAGELIREHGYRFMQDGFSRSVLTWVMALPDDEVRHTLDLALLGADAAVQTGAWPTAARLADLSLTADATTAAGRGIRFGGLQLAWLGSLYTGTLDAMLATSSAIEHLAKQAPTDDLPHHQGEDVARALSLAALANYLAGRSEAALELVRRVRRSGGTLFSNLLADGLESLVSYERGETARAAALARDGLSLISGVAQPPIGAIIPAFAALWTADDRAAGDAAELLRSVCEQGRLPQVDVVKAISVAELDLRAGRYEQATRSLALAERRLGELREPRFVRRFVDLQAARLKVPATDRRVISNRERDVLSLLTGNLTRREIASELGVSMDTVKTHVQRIYRKLDVSTRADAVREARRRRLS